MKYITYHSILRLENRYCCQSRASKSQEIATNIFIYIYIIYVNGVLVLGVEQYWKAKNIAPKPEPNNAKWHNHPIWKQINRNQMPHYKTSSKDTYMHQLCHYKLEMGWFLAIFIFNSSEKQHIRHSMEQNFVTVLYKIRLTFSRPPTSFVTNLHSRTIHFVIVSGCSK